MNFWDRGNMNFWEFLDRNIFTEGFGIFIIFFCVVLATIIGCLLGRCS